MAQSWGTSWKRAQGASWGTTWLDTWLTTWGVAGGTGWGDSWGVGFPAQFFGLKAFYQAGVHDLSLVAEADAPAGMGAVLKVARNGTTYAIYLVETGDPNASPIRIRTSTGTKAIREKT